MNLLSKIYTDEFKEAVANHNNEKWTRLISDLQFEIDDQFLKDIGTIDKDALYVQNQVRLALQTLLTSLITNDEE